MHGFQFEPETDGLVLTLSDSLRFLARDGFIETDLAAQLNRALIADLSQDQASLALIENSLLQIEAELAQPRIGQLSAIRSHISLILLTLLRHARFHLAHAPCPSQDLSLVDRLRSLIAEEMTCKHGVPFYAARLRVTQARLTAACHRVAGCSPLHLLHAALLAEAKRGLLYTERPISEIAYSLGFDDPAYFSRFFTTRSGRTPSIFRAQHIKHRPTQGAQP